jgi:hypothetical protein
VEAVAGPTYNPPTMEELTHDNIPSTLDDLEARILTIRDSL